MDNKKERGNTDTHSKEEKPNCSRNIFWDIGVLNRSYIWNKTLQQLMQALRMVQKLLRSTVSP